MNVTGLAPVYFGKVWHIGSKKPADAVEGTPYVTFHGGRRTELRGQQKEHVLREFARANAYAMEGNVDIANEIRANVSDYILSKIPLAKPKLVKVSKVNIAEAIRAKMGTYTLPKAKPALAEA